MILNDVVTAGAVAPTLGPAAHVAVVITDPVTAGAVAPAVAPAANAAAGAFSTFWTGVVGFAKGTVLPFLATPAALYIGLGLVGLVVIALLVKQYKNYNSVLTTEENLRYEAIKKELIDLARDDDGLGLATKLGMIKKENPKLLAQLEKDYKFSLVKIPKTNKEAVDHPKKLQEMMMKIQKTTGFDV